MHKYMRAIGFSKLESRKRLQELLAETIINADRRGITKNQEIRFWGNSAKISPRVLE